MPVGRPPQVVPRVGVLEVVPAPTSATYALGVSSISFTSLGKLRMKRPSGEKNAYQPFSMVTSPTVLSSAIERISHTFPRWTA